MISEENLKPLNSTAYTFKEFRLEKENLLLFRDSEIVPLAPKASEVLLALVEANGKMLTKQEILDKVWADSFVEEANLAHHISALRKALGEDKNTRKFIETIPRKGYRFIAPLEEASETKIKPIEIVISHRITEKLTDEIETEIETDDSPSQNQVPAIGGANNRPARNKTLTIAIGILLITLLGLVFYGFVLRRSGNKVEVLPTSYMRVSDRSIGSATVSPDGKFVAYIQNYSDIGGGTLFIKQLETNREVRLLEPDERTFGDVNFLPDGSLIYYVSYEKGAKVGAVFSIPILGGIPKRLFNLDAGSAGFAISPDGKQIAFFRDSTETHLISLIVAPLDHAGSETEHVLLSQKDSDPNFDGFLAWSPDGRYLALATGPTSEIKHDARLFQLDLQTGEVSQLSAQEFAGTGKMAYSPDGHEIFFIAEDEYVYQKLFALDLTSRQIRRVTNDVSTYGNYGLGITADGKTLSVDLSEQKGDLWSVTADGETTNAIRIKRGDSNGKRGIASLPDGSVAYIARVGNKYDIWKINPVDAENALPLTNDSFKERDLTASGDGRYLVFTSDRINNSEDTGNRHLFRINAAGGGDLKQLTFGQTIDRQPDFSPDGNWIVYASEQNGRSVIKKIPAEGGTPVALTDEAGFNPVFSPDGSRIAFKILSETRSQPGKIVVIAADGGKPEKVFPVVQFEFITVLVPVRWNPDGKGLVFRNESNGVSNLWQQDLAGSPPRQITNFTSDAIYNFDYSADGKQILFSRGIYQSNAVLIRNFQDR